MLLNLRLSINTIKSIWSLVVTGLLLELHGVSATTDPYALTKDKSSIDYCRKAVLAEQPGQVLEFKSQNTDDGFHYQYLARQSLRPTSHEWTPMACRVC